MIQKPIQSERDKSETRLRLWERQFPTLKRQISRAVIEIFLPFLSATAQIEMAEIWSQQRNFMP